MNYISEAADALHVAGNATNDVPAARYTARAQALATLAMAEQQRIANLIALARVESENSMTPTDALYSIYELVEGDGFDPDKLRTRDSIKAALAVTS